MHPAVRWRCSSGLSKTRLQQPGQWLIAKEPPLAGEALSLNSGRRWLMARRHVLRRVGMFDITPGHFQEGTS